VPALAMGELDRMRDAVFFDGAQRPRKLSRYWLLLGLAAVIASAGVAADSTATVIGAMIVAPLMTPILGVMLAIVLGDRGNLRRCLLLVVAGAAAVVAIGYLSGLVVPQDVVAPQNTQVAGRIHPRIVDLVAAIATGAVGSVALARRDISDTLPGVAIAISLVPPLAVVGLTLSSGAVAQSLGALLLFTTNVTAILATGTAVMAIYGVHRITASTGPEGDRKVNRLLAVLTVAAMLVVVVGALTQSSLSILRSTRLEAQVRDATETWAEATGWVLAETSTREGKVVLLFEGPPPLPSTDALRPALVEAGVDPARVEVALVPRVTVDLG
jgi:uncharacterized hydrophobic protein (TIGR00271 family)